MCSRVQRPITSPKSCWSSFYIHHRLEGVTVHLGAGEGNESGAEGGQEKEAFGVVCELSSADEREVHRGH